MNRARARVRRAKRRRAINQPDPYDVAVREVEREFRAMAAARKAAEAQALENTPEPVTEVAPVAPPPAPVAPAPVPPFKPRPWWEPDPNYVPPPQNRWWEEKCRFRFRRPNEPYVYDEPPEQSEDDALIYGDG